MSADVQTTSAHVQLPPTASAAARARAHVSAWCQRAGASEACDVATLLATELVANAVRHAVSELDLTVAAVDGGIRLSVCDRSRELPQRRAAALFDESGRGLLLIDLLSDRWGVEVHKNGKCVWAQIALRPPPDPVGAAAPAAQHPLLGHHHRESRSDAR